MYLGIDIGTSGVKALLIDDKQTIINVAHADLSVSHPQFGWSEQNPEDWVAAVNEAIEKLYQDNPQGIKKVVSISLSGQMHGATLLDENDKPLRPCILWNDTRSHAEAKYLDAQPIFRKISGNIVFPGFTAPKLLWVEKNEPKIFKKIKRVLLPKDYIRFWLTGEYATDMSDASGTSWLDVQNRKWSDELLSASKMDISQMPKLIEGTQISGHLKSSLVSQWGMSSSVIVSGGGGDNATSACGMGVVKSGRSFVSLGTSGVLFTVNDNFSPRPESAIHAFCHSIPNTWHQMGVILSATDSLNWLSSLLNQDTESLVNSLGKNLMPPSGLFFLPYLSGERTPHNDAQIRGSFIGLEHGHEKKDLVQAALEGVTFAIRDNLEALKLAGTTIERITAVGGGSNSDYWLQSIATSLNIPVDLPQDGDFGGAFGAARLALFAANDSASIDEVFTTPQIKKTIEPVEKLVESYQESYEIYHNLYPKLSKKV